MRIDESVIEVALGPTLDHYNVSVGRGSEAPIRCPAHDDAHASASANLAKGVWYCHACGAGGNALHVIMALESCDMDKASEILQALLVGLDIRPSETRRVHSRKSSKRSKWTPPRLRSA